MATLRQKLLETGERLAPRRRVFKKPGGALINIGSELSDVSVPIQRIYLLSKHGFADTLRDEVLEAELRIAVTLIKPAAIDTPIPHHAKTYCDEETTLPSPVYHFVRLLNRRRRSVSRSAIR